MLVPTLLLAAAVTLGPEMPIGTPVRQSAGGAQLLGSVASNGRDFLATWEDLRAQVGPSATWGGRIDATGHPLELTGHQLATNGIVTSIGSTYLLVNPTTAQPLDEDGRPSGQPTPLHLTITPTEAASNGQTILTVSTAGLNVVDLDGRLLFADTFGPIVRSVSPPAVLPDGNYAFVISFQQCGTMPCDGPIVLATVAGETGAVHYVSLHDIGNSAYDAGANVNPDGTILVSWVEENGASIAAKYELIDANAHTIVAPTLINSALVLVAQQPVVGWDGNEFLVLIGWTPLSGNDTTLRGYRISASGTRLDDANGFALTSTFWQHARIAHAAEAVLVAWDESNGVDVDVVETVAPSFDTIDHSTTSVLAVSAQTQLRPRVAEGGGFAIWQENNELHEQPVGGREDVVTRSVVDGTASVARGKSAYLVVWMSIDPNVFVGIINARRVAFDGTVFDFKPLVVGHTDLLDVSRVPRPAVAFDGTNFLVVWTGPYDLQGARVSDSGTLLDATPIAVSNIGPHSGTPISPRVVWDGTQFVVGWIDSMFLNVLISPVPPIPDFIRLTRVTSAGTVLDPQSIAVWNLGDAQSLSLAANADAVTAMWIGFPDTTFKETCLWAAQLRHDGTASSSRELFCTDPRAIEDVDVAWSGTELVAVWHDVPASDIKAQRFGATLVSLDAQPFEVSPIGSRALQPSIASSPSGTTIGYSRVANEPQFGGVPRVFVRTLDRIGATRPHAAKH